MRALCTLLAALVIATGAAAQSSAVRPGELSLTVVVEEREHVPFAREMVLITIRGEYRRHITRENLIQPDFEGFSWTQLGPDKWIDERIDGVKVKVFERRMAVYPGRAGRLTIGAFSHELTLTDEGDDWFDHVIASDPVAIEVAAAPEAGDWWFPVRALRVSDQWSNAPGLLKQGEGVLRVVRLEALGAMPEMIPPMPDLASPSAIIFPHPEKRLVELSPEGPITYAFWRWTIRPSNDTSAIVEPFSFPYFDTTQRAHRDVVVSAKRVAYGSRTPNAPPDAAENARPVTLPGWPAAALAALTFLGGALWPFWGWRLAGFDTLRRLPWADPLVARLRRGARLGDAALVRRTAAEIIARDGPGRYARRQEALNELDERLFAPNRTDPGLRDFAKSFLKGTPLEP